MEARSSQQVLAAVAPPVAVLAVLAVLAAGGPASGPAQALGVVLVAVEARALGAVQEVQVAAPAAEYVGPVAAAASAHLAPAPHFCPETRRKHSPSKAIRCLSNSPIIQWWTC